MYSPQELFNAVRDRVELKPPLNVGPYPEVDMAIVLNANHGWLCLNAGLRTTVDRNLISYYRERGFRVDRDGIIYWLYRT